MGECGTPIYSEIIGIDNIVFNVIDYIEKNKEFKNYLIKNDKIIKLISDSEVSLLLIIGEYSTNDNNLIKILNDIISRILYIKNILKIKFELYKVKAHQYDIKKYKNNKNEIIVNYKDMDGNQIADILATNGNRINNNFNKYKILEYINKNNIRKYLNNKYVKKLNNYCNDYFEKLYNDKKREIYKEINLKKLKGIINNIKTIFDYEVMINMVNENVIYCCKDEKCKNCDNIINWDHLYLNNCKYKCDIYDINYENKIINYDKNKILLLIDHFKKINKWYYNNDTYS